MKHIGNWLNKGIFSKIRRHRYGRSFAFLMSTLCVVSLSSSSLADNRYRVQTFEENGHLIDKIIVPGRPPTIKALSVAVPKAQLASGINVLSQVPAFTWCYGCSATSAAMMMGYYDNNGYSNMYSGASNGGVCPLNNETYWGNTTWPSVTCGECPLAATHKGIDGRTIRGHVDDYWIDYSESVITDPYITDGVTEHTQGDCTADYMGTNQSKYDNSDGSTTFYNNTDGSPLSNYTGCEPDGRDGCHGMRLFVESRGYTVTNNFSQYIYGYNGNTKGFTFSNFKTEIDAGRPVMIQVEGHSMLGYGYNNTGNTIYIHDTWDNSDHSMTWGGTYSDMKHYGVTVIQIKSAKTAVPSAPAQVSASDGTYTDKVLLTWTASTGATSYKVYRSASNSSASASLLASVSAFAYSDTTAEAGTTYYYWVKASNAGGDSGFSSGDSGRRAVAVTVTFDAQGGSVSPASQTFAVGSTYGALPTPTRATYSFAGWWTGANGSGIRVTASSAVNATFVTLYANWTRLFTVTFDAQGGTAPSPSSKTVTYGSTYGTLASTAHKGCTFAGWWTGAGGSGTRVTENTTVATAANHTLYAKWTANPYTVTFDAQGGLVPSPSSKTVTYGSTYGTLASTTRTGYTFAGWYTNAAYTGVAVMDTTAVSIASDHVLYAKWTANMYTVTFDAQGGTASFQSKSVIYDETYGVMPETTEPAAGRVGYTFGGWWAGAEGSGVQVTASTTVATASDHILYAKWSRNPYIFDPDKDAELTTAGSYDGYFYCDNAFSTGTARVVRGTLSLTMTGVSGKFTAKAVLQKGSLSFRATAWAETNGYCYAQLAVKGSGETLDLYVRQNRIWGTLAGGTLSETLTLDGTRNRFADSKDTEAQTLLNGFTGYYTVALPPASTLSLGSADAAPEGVGYLAVTVGSRGSAKVAGVLADGTSVSMSSRLLFYGGDCGAWVCVPFFVPLYTRKGWSGGLLWISPDDRTVVTDRDLGWYLRWEKPGSGPDGFSELLDACGGYYNTLPSLSSYYLFDAKMDSVPYWYTGGISEWVTNALPDSIGVNVAGTHMTLDKGTQPTKVNGVYTYAETNASLATMVFTAKTGIFKGKFNVYYDYELNSHGWHKVVSVPYAGLLAPVRDSAFEVLPTGLGYCLVPDNAPAVKIYTIKRSFPVWLEDE